MREGAYAELWGVVDGAVADAFNNHPDYLTPKGQRSARTSVVKRVTGTVLGFAVQAAKGRQRPAETHERDATSAHAGEGGSRPSPNPHCRIGRVRFKRVVSSRQMLPFNETTAMLIRARAAQRGQGGER